MCCFLLIASAWDVFIINNGVGHNLNCAGRHIVTLPGEHFSIHTNKKCRPYTWSKSELRLKPFGHLDSMVYLEIPRHGLLWMYCPGAMALELSEAIQK